MVFLKATSAVFQTLPCSRLSVELSTMIKMDVTLLCFNSGVVEVAEQFVYQSGG